ncbi:ethanolamine utilization phosphate acetyltransferase EutD [Oceanotoga sp. DSM 15011]|jgi:propanediol utilization protein|uniref:Phosphate propanoyltransferase n=1 Tax=Oceanotoga teriensis TaxID=515440 RepID=A0AA45C893_9BACT|nr:MULTISPECIES: ethanolamine utilization phosphate acetyltransferase EutD [Oceanotoga]MDO7976871.1 ethanolamine utilization phosphate acetyltransferase EutD [Oceanotoga teriensis]PWJ95951.1 propanediol utilization protein [Oceanotoga teriensis]UYP00826.1 ethanolamine utilization phosphate acetyltransferase EutD [Oceanotoga sp. DSM 15011]
MEKIIEKITDKVINELFIKVEASGRHVHLSQEHLELLFGKNYKLTKTKDLSQPGQYACEERVTLIGPKGKIENVVILGPVRKNTQVEVSKTDLRPLGLNAPIRESGDIKGSGSIKIKTEKTELEIKEGLIIAKRHIHMTPEDAKKHGVKDKEIVNVKIFSNRPLIFEDVVIRVSDNYKTFMHIDYDEANACGFKKDTLAIIKK